MKTYEERLPLIDAAIQCDVAIFYDKYELLPDRLIHIPLSEKTAKPVKNMIYKNDTDEFIGYMDELEKRKAELQNKPSFDDHPDAKCFVQNDDGWWFKNTVTDGVETGSFGDWICSKPSDVDANSVWVKIQQGKVIGNWQDTLEKRPETVVSEHQEEQGSAPTDYISADNDPVNHPPHYTKHPSGVECIQITEHCNFCIGNAIKYLWRAGLKGAAVEDLKKARWYIEREIERLEGEK